jgi:hypothetical protein
MMHNMAQCYNLWGFLFYHSQTWAHTFRHRNVFLTGYMLGFLVCSLTPNSPYLLPYLSSSTLTLKKACFSFKSPLTYPYIPSITKSAFITSPGGLAPSSDGLYSLPISYYTHSFMSSPRRRRTHFLSFLPMDLGWLIPVYSNGLNIFSEFTMVTL